MPIFILNEECIENAPIAKNNIKYSWKDLKQRFILLCAKLLQTIFIFTLENIKRNKTFLFISIGINVQQYLKCFANDMRKYTHI